MLKLMFPLMSTYLIIMFNYSWWISFTIILMLTTYSLSLLSSYSFTAISSYMMMTDQMSSLLTSLSILIAAMMILASTKIMFSKNKQNMFMLLNLTLMIILILCFNSNSLMAFYVWFEASLIPTLLIIALWGYQPERMQAGMYLMMYTITASLPMLMLFMMIYMSSSSMLMNGSIMEFPNNMNSSIFWLMLITGFIVKLPMFSTHLWLPKAHVEAPIAGSMILAAILLKLGGYGLIRIMNMFPTSGIPNNMLISVALYGAMITSLICLRQPDMKSLIAYSSVGHMGIMLAGMLSYSSWGMSAALMMMIAHGLCSSALFIMANLSYTMTHTRSMYLTKGMLSICPTLSMWWFLLLSANMAAPPSLNLLSEIMLISSISSTSITSMIVLALLSFFTAAYSLHMFAITQHGQSSMMLNPSATYKQSDMLLLLIHLTPLVLLILKSDTMLSWY